MKSSHKDTQQSFTFMCTTECKLQKKGPSSAEWNETEEDYLCISLSIDHLFQQHTQVDNTRSRFLHALITITFQPPFHSRNQEVKSVSITLGIILNTFKHHHLPSFLMFNRITPFLSAVVHGWLEEQVKRTRPSPCNGSACEVQQNISTSSFISISIGNTVPNLSHQYHNVTLQVVLLIFTPSSDLAVVLCIITIIRKS